MKRVYVATASVIALAILGAWVSTAGGSPSSSEAKIIFVDVDQGDAVVMKFGTKVIVSDAGEFNVDNVNDALLSIGAKRADGTKRIDYAILSHAHEDHVKNFIALVRVYGWKINLAVLPHSDYWQGTKTNVALMKAIEDVPLQYVTRDTPVLHWGGGVWTILNPPKDKYTGGASQAAAASVAYLLRVNGVRVLFTGDIGPAGAKEVAAELEAKHLVDKPVDIFLATHHGSKNGSAQVLLEAAKPRWAVISTGPNKYGHPSDEAIDRLKAAKASIWCTDANGTVTARISASGKLTWEASVQATPWWLATTKKETGSCVGK